MKHFSNKPLLLALCAATSWLPFQSYANDFWHSYLDSRSTQSDLRDPHSQVADDQIIANFSYAGYQFSNQSIPQVNELGYRVFDVTGFGADIAPGRSDKQAVRDAIAAAEQHIDQGGIGAVIYFPNGTYDLNTLSDVDGIDKSDTANGRISRASATIKVSRGNMVLRGESKQSILKMDQHLDLIYPNKMWTSPYLLEIGYNYSNRDPKVKGVREAVTSPSGERFITDVISSHPRQSTRSVQVRDASLLKVGQWIQLSRFDPRPETIAKALSPYKLDGNWGMIKKGLRSQEYHQITALEGDVVTFAAVIHHDVTSDGYWGLKKAPLLQNIGVENLTIQGNWQEAFKHHKSGVHDGGWSAIRFSRVANAWLRNVEFIDLNQGVSVVNSAAMTIKDVAFTGNPGHISLDINASTHVLAQNIDDQAEHWHAAGFSHKAAGNVISGSTHSSKRFHNLHANMPYSNLIENSKGGWNYGYMGGSVGAQPNHLKHLVFWNVTNTAQNEAIDKWAFMRHDSKYGRVIMPYVIGLKGAGFNGFESQQRYDVSLADMPQAYVQQQTDIESLYASQLQQRRCAKKVISEGLIGAWSLQGSVCDLSGHGQDGKIFSEYQGTFNGVDQRVELGDIDQFSKIELEFKYQDFSTTKTGFMLSKGNYGTQNAYYIQVNKKGVISARVNGKGVNAGNFADGKWHKLEMQLDGNTLSLSIDGQSMGSKSIVLPNQNDVPLSIGSTPKNTYPFKGQVRNVRVYR
ncbi:DUF4955 domain-containing protein [Pseudoalteromonas luteoviolacea]|uniref:Laminin G domain protein n=1 Tax=Pseudoalteromonas luteoviolacea (strain 2ta16) TaxID=1353533 RepID=V4HX30_PSEL2|nr:DUF4955 domain-containing protein [Pseudoalteromonas luteoviolacea]ESP92514.1 Laminin G domain protein [Pseudoalteromonas luteoviolacea 2ta16]KZN35075.1 hypothetical protein N483_24340 [Pseudoalteromonas luteoviolacea NCIMB 1944]